MGMVAGLRNIGLWPKKAEAGGVANEMLCVALHPTGLSLFYIVTP